MGEVIDSEKWDLSKGGRNFVREGDVSPYKGNCFKMSGKEANLLPMHFFLRLLMLFTQCLLAQFLEFKTCTWTERINCRQNRS